MTLGIDTSNYTTSAAVFDGEVGYNFNLPLEVPSGELGLRQSDAVFQHVKRLPEVIEAVLNNSPGNIEAIGVSSRPRAVEGSYMPCFLPGVSVAKILASALKIPILEFSHQQGHIAAAAYSAGRPELMKQPCLAWHLSGGTTELLLLRPKDGNIDAEVIGGTSDISAGQLIDRTGKLLGLPFPSGKALDDMANLKGDYYNVKLDGCTFSLSGVENKLNSMTITESGTIAAYALLTISHAVRRATLTALDRYGDLPVLFSGGVASSNILRHICRESFNAVFAPPEYSTDNAYGVAVLAFMAM